MTEQVETVVTDPEVPVETPETPEVPAEIPNYESQIEQKARSGGWCDQQEWVDKGGKPEDWVDARDFNIRGEYIGNLKKQQKQIDDLTSTISNVNKIHQAELNQKRAEIERLKGLALKEGDAQAVDDYNQQLNSLPNVAPTMVDSSLDNWNAKNPWINENSPKAIFARSIYAQGVAQGQQTATILAMVDQELAKHYPSTEAPKPSQPAAERGSAPGAKGKTSVLTMADLTQEELGYQKAFPEWKDEKVFLKAVADARKAK